MRNSSAPYVPLSLLLILALCAGPAWSANKNPEREALRRMQLLQKKAMEEKSALEQEKADLTKQLSDLNAQTGSLKEEGARAKQKSAVLAKELEVQRAQGTALQDDVKRLNEELLALQKKSQAEHEQADQDKKKLESLLADRNQSIESCEQKNMKLYELDNELLSRYKDKGVLDALFQDEPVTQIKDVEMESAVQEYRDKLETQRVEKPGNAK